MSSNWRRNVVICPRCDHYWEACTCQGLKAQEDEFTNWVREVKMGHEQEYEDILSQRLTASEEIDRLKVVIAECNRLLSAMLDLDEIEQMPWNHNGVWYTVFKRKGSEPRKSIDPVKLLEQGVPAHVIQVATVYGQPGKGGITVRKVTDKDEQSD